MGPQSHETDGRGLGAPFDRYSPLRPVLALRHRLRTMASAIGDTRGHVIENRKHIDEGNAALSRELGDVQRQVGALRQQVAGLTRSLAASAQSRTEPERELSSATKTVRSEPRTTVVDAERPSGTGDISELVAHVEQSTARLQAARDAIGDGIVWYQYPILGNVFQLDALLHGENRNLGRFAAGLPVADIGAADGDLAFTLEQEWGWEVDIVDTAAANQNGLEGARALRDQLGSSVQVHDIDLDAQFRLPRDHYGLVFLLGILYHLQNPFYVLRELARRADYCLISTRVARIAGEKEIAIADIPVAYLVGPVETNNDPTNYWMFSPAGLEQIVDRTGWTVLERFSVGDVLTSNPSSMDHDERTFMLLRSSAVARA